MEQKATVQDRNPSPRFFYGYIIVIASALIILAYGALRYAFGIFFRPTIDEFGWSSAVLSGAFSLSIIVDGAFGMLMGKFADRWGPRKVVTACGFLAGIGFLLMSQVTNVWQMYVVYGLMIGLGMGGIFTPVLSNFLRWFIARRNTMNGIIVSGMGLGTFIVSPVAYWLMSTTSWQTAYLVLGIAFLIVVVASAQFLKRDPSEVGQRPYTRSVSGMQPNRAQLDKGMTWKQALGTRNLWLIFMLFFCFGYVAQSVLVHIVPHSLTLNISSSVAASILAIIGAIGLAGRLLFGFIGDKVGGRLIYRSGFIVMAITMLSVLGLTDAWMLYGFAVVWGFAYGGMGTVQSPIVAELFGTRSIGSIFGFCGLGGKIGSAVGPVLSGVLFDVFGGYNPAFLICALISIAGILMTVTLAAKKTAPVEPIAPAPHVVARET